MGAIPESLFSNDYTILLRLLRQSRKKAGITQDEVAHRIGVVRSMIGKIERGERRLDVVELRNYCQSIGMPLSVFIQQFENALDHPGLLSPADEISNSQS